MGIGYSFYIGLDKRTRHLIVSRTRLRFTPIIKYRLSIGSTLKRCTWYFISFGILFKILTWAKNTSILRNLIYLTFWFLNECHKLYYNNFIQSISNWFIDSQTQHIILWTERSIFFTFFIKIITFYYKFLKFK